jgi:hypothetical protein
MGSSFNRVLGLFAIGLFAIMVYQVTAASLRPPVSTRLYGAKTVWRGHMALFNAQCVDTDGVSPCAHPAIRAGWRATDGKAMGPLVDADATGELRLPVPTCLEAPAYLAVWVQDGARAPIDHFTVPVDPVAHPNRPTGIWRQPLQSAVGPHGMAVTLYPETGELIDGFAARGTGTVCGRTGPGAVAMTTALGSNFTLAGPADAAGHFFWRATPSARRDPWRLHLRDAADASTYELTVTTRPVPRQMRLVAEGPAIVQAGTGLQVELQTLPFRGDVHIDLWAGDSLIDAKRGPAGAYTFTLPADYMGPVVIGAYRQLMAPVDTWVTAVRWQGPATTTQASDAVAPLPVDAGTPATLAAAVAPADARGPPRNAEAMLALAHWAGPALGAGALSLYPDAISQPWLTPRLALFSPETAGMPLLEATHARRQSAFTAAQAQRRRLSQSLLTAALSIGAFCLLAYLRHALAQRHARLVAALPADVADPRAQAQRLSGRPWASWVWACLGAMLLMVGALLRLMGQLL